MEETVNILDLLNARFEKYRNRHTGIEWSDVEAKLKPSPDKIRSLNEMEKSGGAPDVIAYDQKADEYIFADCSPESPAGRRSLYYDREALESRKKHKPDNSVQDVADAMGVEILTFEDYQQLQKLGPFDTKTSSWLKTPTDIRKLGGAIFGDYRYGQVFLYHNGADSYYASRGFRAKLRV